MDASGELKTLLERLLSLYPKKQQAKWKKEIQKSLILEQFKEIESEESDIKISDLILHYTVRRSYIWDYEGLKKFLLKTPRPDDASQNLLRYAVKVNPELQMYYNLSPFLLPEEWNLRLYAGGQKKEVKERNNQEKEKIYESVAEMEIEELCHEYKISKTEFDLLEKEYKDVVSQMTNVYRTKGLYSDLSTDIGVFKWQRSDPKFNMDAIANNNVLDLRTQSYVTSDEFFMQCPTLSENLDHIMDRGWLHPSAIAEFKKVNPGAPVSYGFEIIEEQSQMERRSNFFQKNVRRGQNLNKYENLI